MEKIRVLVVDDQNVVREGLVAVLGFCPHILVVGQAEDGVRAIELAQTTQPDVILLDLVMPNLDGLEAIPRIKEVAADARILVLTSFADGQRVFQAIKLGALGYLLKDATRDQLFRAIEDVAEGLPCLPPAIALKVIREMDQPSPLAASMEPLTARELETLRLIARGLSNQEIARELVVHERTIAKYVSSILYKLHLANRTQAALYAVQRASHKTRASLHLRIYPGFIVG
jgi:NarL family two-component system response regulator LiaR